MATINQAERLLPLPAVLDRTSLKRAWLYAAVSKGDFPRPVRLSPNRVAWPESAVAAWIASKMEAVNQAESKIGGKARQGLNNIPFSVPRAFTCND